MGVGGSPEGPSHLGTQKGMSSSHIGTAPPGGHGLFAAALQCMYAHNSLLTMHYIHSLFTLHSLIIHTTFTHFIIAVLSIPI